MIHFHVITARGTVHVFSTQGDRLILPPERQAGALQCPENTFRKPIQDRSSS